MAVFTWAILGAVAGFVASKLINYPEEGLLFNTCIGIIGAVISEWLFTVFGLSGITGLNFPSLLVAIVGAALLIPLYQALFGRGG